MMLTGWYWMHITGECPSEIPEERPSSGYIEDPSRSYTYDGFSIYNGTSLMQEVITTATTTDSGTTTTTETLNYSYDASGTPISVNDNGTVYYYATNVQGDVTAILDTNGTAVVEYTYDAWGNILSASGSMTSSLGTLTPLRCRGYVCDAETGYTISMAAVITRLRVVFSMLTPFEPPKSRYFYPC